MTYSAGMGFFFQNNIDGGCGSFPSFFLALNLNLFPRQSAELPVGREQLDAGRRREYKPSISLVVMSFGKGAQLNSRSWLLLGLKESGHYYLDSLLPELENDNENCSPSIH